MVRHADGLAVRLGEPFGTLILTLAVISIEVVMISAVMVTGEENPALARDTMFAVLMIVLNGMLGLTLLLGGLKHHEQDYNLRGASAYLGVLIPLAAMCIVMPRFTDSTPDSSAVAALRGLSDRDVGRSLRDVPRASVGPAQSVFQAARSGSDRQTPRRRTTTGMSRYSASATTR